MTRKPTRIGMRPTRIGLAPPAQSNKRPSGRYVLQAPDAPVGAILRVKTRGVADEYEKLVVVAEANDLRFFLDHYGEEVRFTDWEYATRVEAALFKFRRKVVSLVDVVDLRGVPAFYVEFMKVQEPERRLLLEAISQELESRGKPGKASQVQAYVHGEYSTKKG